MKKLLFIFIISSGFAALPPLAQSTRELQSLLADPRFYESLGSAEWVNEILRTEKGYVVLTQNYALQVDVRRKEGERHKIGPASFQLDFYEPISLREWERAP